MSDVLEGIMFAGAQNVSTETILAHVRHSIRQGHPQVWRHPEQADRVVLVGSGPSLADTEAELVQLVHEGVVLATVNGAYHWCLERNLRPSVQIVLDARPSTARFVVPEVPRCTYYVASQCHADVWSAVSTYARVGIFHALGDADLDVKAILDTYYAEHWQGVAGGTTVGSRAIGLLRMLGYLRFDLFGIDCCWLEGEHHALPQPENEGDTRLRFRIHPGRRPDLAREFDCSVWHAKQFEDLLMFMRHLGQHVQLQVHGNGMFAYAIQALADGEIDVHQIGG